MEPFLTYANSRLNVDTNANRIILLQDESKTAFQQDVFHFIMLSVPPHLSGIYEDLTECLLIPKRPVNAHIVPL